MTIPTAADVDAAVKKASAAENDDKGTFNIPLLKTLLKNIVSSIGSAITGNVPIGGTTGQVLTKASNADLDADWETPAAPEIDPDALSALLATLPIPIWHKFPITYQSALGAGVTLMAVTAGMILQDWFVVPTVSFDDNGTTDLALYVDSSRWEKYLNTAINFDLALLADNVSTSISRAGNSPPRQGSIVTTQGRVSNPVITGGNLIAKCDGFAGDGSQGAATIYVLLAAAPT